MPKPNILFVFADQLRHSAMGCYGNKDVQTPTLDQMAREGVVFDQAFSGCPICSPYRAQILTGRYSHANGVICNEYELFRDQTTIAQALSAEGYRTAYVGKWHLGYPPYTEEKRYGFDDLYAYNCCHQYYRTYYNHNEGPRTPMVEYAPRCETQLTLDYIRRHLDSDSDQPFALFLSWGPPHWTRADSNEPRNYGDYPQEYNIYDPARLEVPGNVPGAFRHFAAEELADYYGMVTSLDDCMADLLNALDRWGEADNTIVCFSSDHGDHLNAHGIVKPADYWMHHTMMASKASPYEEACHIPFVMRYPDKVKGNRRTDTLFNSVDVMPTLLGLCDIDIPDGVQGTDLSHAAIGAEGPEPDSVYLQIMGPGWPGRDKWIGLWRGVRTHDYTYARWADRDGLRMLYDLNTDPLEMTNVVDDPAYADIAAAMEKRLQQWLAETDDPFDTGPRYPGTDMLDVGQRFIDERHYDSHPIEYSHALRKARGL